MNVTEALKSRISIRAFKPDPISEALVREILDVARYAPSGGNLQP
jgi:nitroreductase